MAFATYRTEQNLLIGMIGLGATFAVIAATAGPSGWLWTGVRALNALVFIVVLIVWLVGRFVTNQKPTG